MFRIRPDRSLKNLNLCNAEIEEVVDLMKIARARVIRVHGEGMQGLDPGLGNHDRVAKKEGWKDSWWYTSDEQAPPKAKAKAGMLALEAPPVVPLQDLRVPVPPRGKKRRRTTPTPRSLGTSLGEWELEKMADGMVVLKSESADKYATVPGTESGLDAEPFLAVLGGKYVIVVQAAGGLLFF